LGNNSREEPKNDRAKLGRGLGDAIRYIRPYVTDIKNRQVKSREHHSPNKVDALWSTRQEKLQLLDAAELVQLPLPSWTIDT
jgi:hypothetical protein